LFAELERLDAYAAQARETIAHPLDDRGDMGHERFGSVTKRPASPASIVGCA
jgi:hypothetical protein